jgi:two-component system, response regulator
MLENSTEILLVDDNPNAVRLALHALQRYNLTNHIQVVRDGAEALEFLFCTGAYAHRNIIHAHKVVLLDLKLPLVHGLEVVQQIAVRTMSLRNQPPTLAG